MPKFDFNKVAKQLDMPCTFFNVRGISRLNVKIV